MTTASPVLEGPLGALRLREIGSFVVLAEELHYARAAQRLRLSKGGLSRRITALERALGAELVSRSPTVRLTSFGEQFLVQAVRLTQELRGSSAPAGVDLAT